MTPLHGLIKNIANLLKVKTVITLAIVFTFCFMTLNGREISNEFMFFGTAIVTYYFCRNDKKGEKEEKTY